MKYFGKEHQRYFLILIFLVFACTSQKQVPYIPTPEQQNIIKTATTYLDSLPVTVTAAFCERSAGGPHDFYSEGDYWWPDSENPGGPYIQKDGQSNPDNFSSHRHAMIRLSEHTAKLTSAWLLTGEDKFAAKATGHLLAWCFMPRQFGAGILAGELV